MKNLQGRIFPGDHNPKLTASEFLKYIGPGFLITIGFIDPGNWASNISAGSDFGYKLLWVVTLSTIMLIVLQHNAAHLGIASGYCLSEATKAYCRPWIGNLTLISAMIASIATSFAEILGGAIALRMLFHIPLSLGVVLLAAFVLAMLFTSSYKRIEKWIICFVSFIGLSFIVELIMVHASWPDAARGWVAPAFPHGSVPIVMSVLGAVVMPHNLFLHSEIIQSRQWNLEDDKVIKKQLDFEFMDTLLSMIVGWAINSAMVIVAASTFFAGKIKVTDLAQAYGMLTPLLGNAASIIFALALLFSGISSSITAGMAGGSIFTGFFLEPYDIHDSHTRFGVALTIIAAAAVAALVKDPFRDLIYSQMLLSVQLPITIFVQIYLTSSKRVMGKFVNSRLFNICLWTIAVIVSALNLMLLLDVFKTI